MHKNLQLRGAYISTSITCHVPLNFNYIKDFLNFSTLFIICNSPSSTYFIKLISLHRSLFTYIYIYHFYEQQIHVIKALIKVPALVPFLQTPHENIIFYKLSQLPPGTSTLLQFFYFLK